MKTKKTFFGMFLLGIFFLLFSFGASAQMMPPPGDLSEEEREEMREKFENMSEEEKEAMKEQMGGGRGMKSQENGDGSIEKNSQFKKTVNQRKVSQVKEAFDNRIEKFDQLVEKINELILELEADEVDTSNLEEKLESFNTMMDDVELSHSLYMEKIEEVEDLSDETIIAEVDSLKEDLKDKVNIMKDFYRNELRSALVSLLNVD